MMVSQTPMGGGTSEVQSTNSANENRSSFSLRGDQHDHDNRHAHNLDILQCPFHSIKIFNKLPEI